MHSMLKLITTPSLSVATIEPAIEFRVPGASQTIVRPHHGITFHQGLQAALNQDPNVVLITSVPDRPTAELSVQAAVGGHLVIAGIHANNAAAALAHLRALTDEPFLLSTAIHGVISQRLVRALCPHCRERFAPTPEQIVELWKAFGVTTPAAKKRLHDLENQAAAAGVDSNKYANTSPSQIIGLWRASDEGCAACAHSGYRGSVAVTELLTPSEAVQKAILEQEPAPKIHAAALKSGFISMELDGLVKALRGQTTVQEILRTFGV